MSRKRTAILISGRGSNMVALMQAAASETFPAEIVLVLSNVPDAPGLTKAASAGIATKAIDHALAGKAIVIRALLEATFFKCCSGGEVLHALDDFNHTGCTLPNTAAVHQLGTKGIDINAIL